MRTRTRLGLWVGLVAIGGSALAVAPAAAEGFLDIYLGAAFVENDNVRFDESNPAAGLPSKRHADFYTSPSGGIRGGYWFEGPARFIGLGLDLSYYGAFEDRNNAPFDFLVTPMTPLLMARFPLGRRDETFPGGRLQPYAAVGPALNISFAYGNTSELNTGLDDFGDTSFDVGLDVRGGLAVHIARRVGLFTEYRFTYFEPDYHDEVSFPGPNVDIDVKPTLATHHVVFGVSFRF